MQAASHHRNMAPCRRRQCNEQTKLLLLLRQHRRQRQHQRRMMAECMNVVEFCVRSLLTPVRVMHRYVEIPPSLQSSKLGQSTTPLDAELYVDELGGGSTDDASTTVHQQQQQHQSDPTNDDLASLLDDLTAPSKCQQGDCVDKHTHTAPQSTHKSSVSARGARVLSRLAGERDKFEAAVGDTVSERECVFCVCVVC
jgi:hypothetical protein